MTTDVPRLDGLVPDSLRIRDSRITLDSLEVMTDIGFHDFEVGSPQRLLVSVEIRLDPAALPTDDCPIGAWDYDVLRSEIRRLAADGRYNLQETLAKRIYDRFAARAGVRALKVVTRKPDIYGDAQWVGVELSGGAP